MNGSGWIVAALVLGACSAGTPSEAKQADGSYHLACPGPLSACLERAERLCQGHGYVVAGARDVTELLGHEQGQSQVEVRRSDATIYCGAEDPSAQRASAETKQPVSAPAPEPTSRPTAPERACVPGATQACVGPAGCAGGQACALDGSRYEPCNCGAP